MESSASEKRSLRNYKSCGNEDRSPMSDLDLEDENGGSKGITFMLCMSTFGASIGTSFLCGYNLGIVNNPATMMKKQFTEMKLSRTGSAFTSSGVNWYWYACVAALPILAPFGCFIGSRAAKWFGRKNTIMANNILLALSGLLQALTKPAKSYEMFFLGRLIIGLHTGISTTVGPMYVSEVSPIKYRGAFGALNVGFFVSGTLASSIVSFEEIFGNKENWPHLFTTLLGFAAVQLFILSFCPESPQFLLIEKQDRNAAQEALRRLRGKEYFIERDLQQIVHEDEKTRKLPTVSYADFYVKRELRNPLLLAFGTHCCLQFSGIIAIMLYSEPIFAAVISTSGYHNSNMATRLVALITLLRLIVAAISMPFIDKIGRRFCQLWSIAGMIVCNTVLAVLLSNVATEGQTCYGITVTKTTNYIAIAFIFLQSVTVAFGVNQIAWIIPPELFRTNARPKAMFMATTVYWIANFLVSVSFDFLQTLICGWVFMIFTAFLVFFFFYFWFYFPVIDGKTTDDVACLFEDLPDRDSYSRQIDHCEEKETCRERRRLLK